LHERGEAIFDRQIAFIAHRPGDALSPALLPAAPTPRMTKHQVQATWSKWILKPLIWGAATTSLFDAIRDNEVRRKLSLHAAAAFDSR